MVRENPAFVSANFTPPSMFCDVSGLGGTEPMNPKEPRNAVAYSAQKAHARPIKPGRPRAFLMHGDGNL